VTQFAVLNSSLSDGERIIKIGYHLTELILTKRSTANFNGAILFGPPCI